jgi:hypothetical protein
MGLMFPLPWIRIESHLINSSYKPIPISYNDFFANPKHLGTSFVLSYILSEVSQKALHKYNKNIVFLLNCQKGGARLRSKVHTHFDLALPIFQALE